MKVAAILCLLLAIGLGIWSGADYYQNYQIDQRHVQGVQYRQSHGAIDPSRDLAELSETDQAESRDGVVALIAFCALIASIVLFSQGRKREGQ